MSFSSSNAIKAAAAAWLARRDAGLSRVEAGELAAWLASDPRHREALERCESAWGALDRPFHAGAAHDLISAVESRVRHQRQRRMRSVMAGVAVLTLMGLAWPLVAPRVSSVALFARPPTAVVILPSQQLLPDGSSVELNGDASITTDFDGVFRRVVLQRGEAHFQVVRDPARPFVVVVDNIEVRAVGTAFSVQRQSEKVEVLVTEGRVAVDKQVAGAPGAADAVTVAGPDAPQTIATLDGGDRTLVSLAPSDVAPPTVEALTSVELNERMVWRAPRLEFSGTPLAEAIALLNEQLVRTAVAGRPAPRYVVDDPQLATMRVSGLFRVDTTDAFVRLLKTGFGIDASAREGTPEIVLHKAR